LWVCCQSRGKMEGRGVAANTKLTGRITNWNNDEGFGYITGIDDKSYYYHVSEMSVTHPLKLGFEVIFTPTPRTRQPGKLEAKDVMPKPSSGLKRAELPADATVKDLISQCQTLAAGNAEDSCLVGVLGEVAGSIFQGVESQGVEAWEGGGVGPIKEQVGEAGETVVPRCDSDGVVGESEEATETKPTRRSRGRRGRGAKEGRPYQAPAEPNASADRPCEHNSWDGVRVKKEKTTLRCRICQLQWKVDHEYLRGAKCQPFAAKSRCKHGSQCTHIHIHRYKQNLAMRKGIWGENLRVPQRAEDDLPPPLVDYSEEDDSVCQECDNKVSPPLSFDSYSSTAPTPAHGFCTPLPSPPDERPAPSSPLASDLLGGRRAGHMMGTVIDTLF